MKKQNIVMDDIIIENYKYKLIKNLMIELIVTYNKSEKYIMDILKIEIKENEIMKHLNFYDIIIIKLKNNIKYIKDYKKYNEYIDKQIIILQKTLYDENFEKSQLR